MQRLLPIAVLFAVGCRSGSAPAPVDTGAKEIAVAWFTAMAAGNAADARAMLDSESLHRVSSDAFARQAAAYSKKVGYHVDRVHVQTCEENGDAATIHVVLIGRSGGHSRRFQDAVALRRSNGIWKVVLSSIRA